MGGARQEKRNILRQIALEQNTSKKRRKKVALEKWQSFSWIHDFTSFTYFSSFFAWTTSFVATCFSPPSTWDDLHLIRRRMLRSVEPSVGYHVVVKYHNSAPYGNNWSLFMLVTSSSLILQKIELEYTQQLQKRPIEDIPPAGHSQLFKQTISLLTYTPRESYHGSMADSNNRQAWLSSSVQNK